jgi:hypothetical protein
MTGVDYIQYIHCPVCDSHHVLVDRTIGDTGGTEALNIDCIDCENETRVHP